MLSLLQQFQPILKKYGRKLWGEDGLEDMIAAFFTGDSRHEAGTDSVPCGGAVVQYLVQSVRHAYERLQRERMRQPAIAFSRMKWRSRIPCRRWPRRILTEKQRFSDLVKGCPRLTEKETYVLEQVYYWGYTAGNWPPDGDQQANVNQIKLRALGKLRRQWETEGSKQPPRRGCFTMELVRDLE